MSSSKTTYILKRGDDYLVFPTEAAACEFLGVARCSVASCYMRKVHCKGYEIIRGTSEQELYMNKRLNKIWESMHARCEYKKHPHFDRYGGRGITVCEEWNNYLSFAKWAFRNGYSDSLTIDRIDSSKGYYPDNCRWATMEEQQNNKSSNRIVVYNGESYTITRLARKIGMNKTTLRSRLESGWSIADAVEKPVNPRTKGYRVSTRRYYGFMEGRTTQHET